MAYFLTGDEFADDPAWEVLAEGKAPLVDALQASFQRLCAKTAHMKDDGYLTAKTAQRYATNRRVLALLTTSVLGRSPKLHNRGDECECLGDDPWIDGFDYRIHKFLKRNPSRKEQDRRQAQKKDLENVALKHLVWVRDGGCCRYCRSGILNKKSGRCRDLRKVLNFDHEDPDQPAGPHGENFLTACKRCNTHKGARTPAEADMVVLPVPTEAEKAEWEKRGPMVFDLVLHQSPITTRTAADQPEPVDPGVDRPIDPPTDQTIGQTDDTTGQLRPGTADEQHEQPRGSPSRSPGRVGEPPPPGTAPGRTANTTAQPPRTSAWPDIYHGRSRAPSSSPAPPPSTPPSSDGSPP